MTKAHDQLFDAIAVKTRHGSSRRSFLRGTAAGAGVIALASGSLATRLQHAGAQDTVIKQAPALSEASACTRHGDPDALRAHR